MKEAFPSLSRSYREALLSVLASLALGMSTSGTFQSPTKGFCKQHTFIFCKGDHSLHITCVIY